MTNCYGYNPGRKFLLIIFIALLAVFFFSQVYAFVPKGKHIIQLSVDTIVEPTGIKVKQKRKIYLDPEDQMEKKISVLEINETLWLSYPGKLRSEGESGNHNMICVESRGQFIKIIDEFLESKEKPLTDFYTDILLYRKAGSLEKELILSGVDVNQSSLKRYKGMIYFVVGVPASADNLTSSFWVEKDTLFPGRYTIFQNGLFVDILYKDWQKVSRTWYPMKIMIFLDNKLVSEIFVDKFKLTSHFKKNFFNIKRLIDIYPESSNYQKEFGSEHSESDVLEKSIIEFKKLYE